MNRRSFFKRAAILVTGAIAVDQLELLERLSHSKIFSLGAIPPLPPLHRIGDTYIQQQPFFRGLRVGDIVSFSDGVGLGSNRRYTITAVTGESLFIEPPIDRDISRSQEMFRREYEGNFAPLKHVEEPKIPRRVLPNRDLLSRFRLV